MDVVGRKSCGSAELRRMMSSPDLECRGVPGINVVLRHGGREGHVKLKVTQSTSKSSNLARRRLYHCTSFMTCIRVTVLRATP